MIISTRSKKSKKYPHFFSQKNVELSRRQVINIVRNFVNIRNLLYYILKMLSHLLFLYNQISLQTISLEIRLSFISDIPQISMKAMVRLSTIKFQEINCLENGKERTLSWCYYKTLKRVFYSLEIKVCRCLKVFHLQIFSTQMQAAM